MSGLKIRPTLSSFFTLLTTAFFAVFLYVSPVQAAEGEASAQGGQAYLIVPDMVLGNVEGTEEVFSSLYTELEKQGVPTENISNFRYDPYDGITTITEKLDAELDRLTTETGDTEISVLGYGVGGLIVRNYLETELYSENIESLVFAATPHEGTIAYTQHIFGQNISYLNAWERLYWEGKDVPMLMKQVLPTNLPLVGVSLEDEALTPLREAVAYSIIEDLKNREQDAESPIKNLTVTNLRPSGYRDGWYFTPTRIRARYSTTLTSVRQQTLEGDLVLELNQGEGDGYVTKTGASFPIGTTRDYWAKHEEIIHQGIRDVISGLGLSTGNLDTYHKQGIYDRGNFTYPKEYHAVAFKTDTTDDLELISLDTSAIQDALRVEEEGRVLLFKTESGTRNTMRGLVTAQIDSHARQDIYLTTFLANSRQHINYKVDTFTSEVGEKFSFTLDLNPYCVAQNWQTSCSLLSNDSYPYNVWQETSREWIQYPIVLVHGILGGWNPEMMGLDGKTFPGLLGQEKQMFEGEEWVELGVDINWQRIRGSLRENKQYYQFFYDWRQSNEVSGEKLDEYISFVKQDSGSDKVQILAHSMGGLVTRSYIQSDQYDQDVAKIVMAGTPNHGATSSIPKWQFGKIDGGWTLAEKYAQNLFNWILTEWHPFLDKELSNDDKRNVIRGLFEANNVPGVLSLEELLPTYNSLKVFFGTEGFGTSIFEPTPNPFLNNLNQDISSLYGHDILFVVGNQEGNTPREYHIRRNDQGEIVRYGGYNAFESGDGTVLIDSLLLPCENGRNLTGDDGICRNESGGVWARQDIESGHMGIPSNACEDTLAFLNHDQSLCESQPYSTETAQPINNETQTFDSIGFSIASPVDIEVITPSGKVFNKFTNEEQYFENNAFYLSLGEEGKKIIMLPYEEQGEYQVNLTAVGKGGAYDVITWLETDEQSLDISNSGEIAPEQEKEYLVTVEENEEGLFNEESIKPILVNNPPTAVLDQEIYEGVEGAELIFDASLSSDEDGDTLQFKWTITDTEGNEIISSEFLENSSYSYTFSDPFNGYITLTVADGEFEDSVSANISVRVLTFQENVSQIRGLFESLEEDTSYIQAKKRLWIRLIDLTELPQVEKNDRLKDIILQILERDIDRSLIIDQKLGNTWLWWRRIDLISNRNETLLRQVNEKIVRI